MLLSLVRILLFVVIVAALAMGGTYLMDTQNALIGNVTATVAGTEYTFSPIQAVIMLLILIVAVWVLLKVLSLLVAVLKFINGDETAFSRYFYRNRERRGYQALSEGMLALASGEGHVAMQKASKAEKFLNKPELTNLVAAQAAELTGDRNKAEVIYKSLIQDPKTRFVGVRGIMKQKLSDGDTDTALKLAQKAFDIKPKHVETQDVLLQLQAQSEDWTGARKTLGAKLKHGSLPRDVHKRRDAVLALSQAKEILDQDNTIDAKEAAIEANRLSPDLVPAAVMAARSYIEDGKGKYATRVVTKAWASQPHPDLATVFSEIDPDETPEARIKRFAKLVKSAPDHRESKLVMAELHLAAEDFPGARSVMGDMVETDADARSLTIMAAIERGEGGDDNVVRGWLTKALSAPRGPQWVCENCNTVHADWAPVCDSCDALDTMAWKEPPQSGVATSTGLEMLPLLVSSPSDEDESMPSVVEDADIVEADVINDDATTEGEDTPKSTQ